MVASGEVLVQTVASAGLRWQAIANRMSPIVKDLPPSAKTCHHLPRAASFLGRVWWAVFHRNWGLFEEHVLKFVVDNMLGRIDGLNQTEPRSVSRDLLLENEGEGTRGPVTVCHINFAGLPGVNTARPFRALRFVWRPFPKALPWAEMGLTFGAYERDVSSNYDAIANPCFQHDRFKPATRSVQARYRCAYGGRT